MATARRGIGGERVQYLIAYIDPGSGSLIIQAIIATVIAVPFFFRQQIGRALGRARRHTATTGQKHDV